MLQKRNYPKFALVTFLYERWPYQGKRNPMIVTVVAVVVAVAMTVVAAVFKVEDAAFVT